MTTPNLNFVDIAHKSMDDALKERGTANILIAGKTGVGKSTLINAVFQGKMADTGQGSPVTQHTRRITKEGIPISIYDTKGLELKDYRQILKELSTLIIDKGRSTDPKEHIHVAWICIAESSRRVEDAELELLRDLSERIPVIIVITTAVSDNGFKKIVEDLMPEARNVVRVNSTLHVLDGGHTIHPHGLKELVDVTLEVIPDGQKKAFAAAQRVSLKQKEKYAISAVAGAAAVAAGVGATPIPFSDAIAIVPIQISMMAGISAAFGLDVSKGFLFTLVASTFPGIAGTIGGRAAAGALLKLIPGVGSIVGGTISASVAAAITTTFGMTYITTLKTLLQDDPDRVLDAEDVAKAFNKTMRKDDKI